VAVAGRNSTLPRFNEHSHQIMEIKEATRRLLERYKENQGDGNGSDGLPLADEQKYTHGMTTYYCFTYYRKTMRDLFEGTSMA
jgi:hypothetical protein